MSTEVPSENTENRQSSSNIRLTGILCVNRYSFELMCRMI